ncbi:MAG TPA: hypothetical protein VFU21_29465 [Kofleriaceae bacterium]|nr:hypothetical protein [Kofleriaceae bacterium]
MRERGLHRALIALAAVGLTPGAAGAQPVPRVGVAVATGVNIAPGEAQAMSEALGKALHRELRVDVIAGGEAARRLPEEGLADGCVVDRACIADVAQRLSADQLLFLVVVKVGSRVQVDSTWADPATGKTVSRAAVVIESGQDPEAQFAAAAATLMPDAAPRPKVPVVEPPPGGDADGPTFITRQRPRRMTRPAWIAAGVGGAALAGAVTFTLLTRSDYQDCDRRAACSDGELDSIEKKALAADILWGTAVVSGAAVGLLYWMSGGQMEQVPAGAVGLRPGPGTIGLAVGGRL